MRLVVRLGHLRLFRPPLFPRACLRQALALYHTLTRLGYPVEIHFGVRKAGKDLQGHSWVTVQGMPVAEQTRTAMFTTVYAFCTPHPTLYKTHEGPSYAKGRLLTKSARERRS